MQPPNLLFSVDSEGASTISLLRITLLHRGASTQRANSGQCLMAEEIRDPLSHDRIDDPSTSPAKERKEVERG